MQCDKSPTCAHKSNVLTMLCVGFAKMENGCQMAGIDAHLLIQTHIYIIHFKENFLMILGPKRNSYVRSTSNTLDLPEGEEGEREREGNKGLVKLTKKFCLPRMLIY
ncbi:hypothetical protein POVCU2_0006890 [Plasmodium ovale curtisi]|uniref:Uncharacterized protein n=1 Tax=Plasmodium ovale curtisi TaxID=864141 RepID=A0A1A8VSV8_PLAOA|nr:hypothetical protein POVCU2_0006890 [Plasmodium ovale curtisi]SBS81903.1 hypothetical protein POVCU1_006230 [Plasmodium ovale curtisi]